MDENTYFIGLGDYADFASASEQKALLKTAGLHDQTIEDFGDMVRKRNRALSMEMSFMKPNVLGLIDGNHNWMFSNGTTATEDLADRLMTEYLGWLCHYTLSVKPENSSKSINVYLVACHGRAGGKTPGNTINQVGELRNIFPVADLYVFGHDHQRGAWPNSILVPSSGKDGITTLKQKRQFLCRSGSFKKAYEHDKSGYEVGRLLRPADLGALLLEISFHRDQTEGDRIITDISAVI
jgi:hypothetical protein